MERLRCVVERMMYQNEQNGYTVLKCKAKGYNDLVTVVGEMPEVHVGAVLPSEERGGWMPSTGGSFLAERIRAAVSAEYQASVQAQ